MTGHRWDWAPRATPLPPAAAFADGLAARSLAAATHAAVLGGRELRVAWGPRHVLVMGRAEDLPWAPGVAYVGWEGPLLMPTTQGCSTHPDLLAQAFRQRYGPGQFLVLPGKVVAYEASAGELDLDWLSRYAKAGAP